MMSAHVYKCKLVYVIISGSSDALQGESSQSSADGERPTGGDQSSTAAVPPAGHRLIQQQRDFTDTGAEETGTPAKPKHWKENSYTIQLFF